MYAVELVQVTKRFGDFIAVDNINMMIKDGEFFSMLGPSGCGKTTTLRLIAGFDMPTTGEIRLMDRNVADQPPHKRPVNTVFQSYALFPHLTVSQNIAFGLEMQRIPRAEIKDRVKDALAMVRMEQFANRRPQQLSGGQQQRIALARALVNKPQVLLLDEPLGALDLKLRKEMQIELKEMQSEIGITFVYVTHDQEEALTMSDRIAVMHNGKVLQCAAPREIYEKPQSRYVAGFIGETNFLEGTLGEVNEYAHVTMENGLTLRAARSEFRVNPGQKVAVALRPEKIEVFSVRSSLKQEQRDLDTIESDLKADSRNVVLRGKVREAIYIGTDTRYVVQLGENAQVVARIQNFGNRFDQPIDKGEEVVVQWPTEMARILVD
jgi:spermidine/putrescine transport system ATP-binding protein